MELLPVTVKEMLESDDIKRIKKVDIIDIGKEALIELINFIPGVGGGIAAELKVVKDARNSYLEFEFFRKLLVLIYGIQDLAPQDIKTFLADVSEKAQDFSGNVMANMINRIDNINKATVLANLIRARVEENISIHDFFRLSTILERIPYIDLNELEKYEEPYYDESGDTELLYATGALKLAVIDVNDENKYILSNIGALVTIQRIVYTRFCSNYPEIIF